MIIFQVDHSGRMIWILKTRIVRQHHVAKNVLREEKNMKTRSSGCVWRIQTPYSHPSQQKCQACWWIQCQIMQWISWPMAPLHFCHLYTLLPNDVVSELLPKKSSTSRDPFRYQHPSAGTVIHRWSQEIIVAQKICDYHILATCCYTWIWFSNPTNREIWI